MKSWIDKLKENQELSEYFDEQVEIWHKVETGLELHEFLGFKSFEDYALFMGYLAN